MVTLRCSLQKRFPAFITDVLERPSSGCVLTFCFDLVGDGNSQATNEPEREATENVHFFHSGTPKGVCQADNELLRVRGGQTSVAMDAARTNGTGQTNSPTGNSWPSTGILGSSGADGNLQSMNPDALDVGKFQP